MEDWISTGFFHKKKNKNHDIKWWRDFLLIFVFFSGTLTVEEVYRDRDQFAALVREVAAPDVGRMGIEILSFTIKDVYDEVQYLASLGKAQTAMVKRDADAGVAEANRDAGIRVSPFFFTKIHLTVLPQNVWRHLWKICMRDEFHENWKVFY